MANTASQKRFHKPKVSKLFADYGYFGRGGFQAHYFAVEVENRVNGLFILEPCGEASRPLAR